MIPSDKQQRSGGRWGGNRSGRARDGGRVGSRLGVVGANQYDSDDDSVVSFSDDAMDIDNIANPNEF